MIAVQVPGKVMLSGEYAVLHGGSAVMVPVPRYLKLKEIAKSDSMVYSAVVAGALEIAISEIEAYEAKYGKPDLTIDSSDFMAMDSHGNLSKLGLGLSAAEVVGVIALRFERAGMKWSKNRDPIHKYADTVHFDVQKGLGSGADVAACAYGQPLRFKKRDDTAIVELIDEHKIIHDVPLQLVWSGKPANTRLKIERFDAWLRSGGRKSEAMLSRLIESADMLANSWFFDAADDLFEKIDEFGEIMKEISGSAGLEYNLPIHDELDSWARKHGGRAKPTGAGGGDMILLIGELDLKEIDQDAIKLHS